MNPQAFHKQVKSGKRGKVVAIAAFVIMALASLACGDGGKGGDSSWVGNTGVDGAMAAVPGNVVSGFDVLGQVLNK